MKAKILIVESTSNTGLDTQSRLRQLDIDVVAVVSTGEQAIKATAKSRPDLMLVDLALPCQLDAIAAARQIRTVLDVPTVYLVEDPDDEALQQILPTRPDGCLVKPFKDCELVITIDQAISRHKMEKALRDSRQWLSTLLGSMDEAMIAVDHLGQVSFMNSVAEALIGWPQDKAQGKELSAILHLVDEGTHQSIAAPPAHAKPMLLTTASGDEIPVIGKVTPIQGTRGDIRGAVWFFQDITERKRIEETLRRRVEELGTLQATILDITIAHDLSTLLHTIVERAARLLNAPSGGLYLCEPDLEQVRCVVSYNTPHDYCGTVLKFGEGASGIVAQTGTPLAIDDYRTWTARAAVFENEKPFTAVLAVPMIWQGRVIGVLNLVHYETHHFTQDELALLTLFANHATIAVENTRLYEQTKKEIAERTRLEQQLEERRLYLEHVLASAPDAIVALDAKHRITAWNRGAEELFGYSAMEAIGRDLDELIAAGTVQMHTEATGFTQQALRGNAVPPSETIRYRKDGRPVPVVVAGSPILIQNEIAGMVAVYSDITERKRAEAALRESEEGYRHLFEDSPICLWEEDFSALKAYLDRLLESGIRDIDAFFTQHPEALTQCAKMARVLSVNKASMEFYQVESRDALCHDLSRVLTPESYHTFQEELVAIAEGKTSFASDVIAETLAGDRRYTYLRWSVAPGYEKTFAKVLVSVIDITDRRRTEEEIRQLKEFNERIVQGMAEGIAMQNAGGHFTFVNPAAASLLGCAAGELEGQHWTMVVPPDQQPIIQAADERRKAGKSDRYEVELVRKDGKRVPVLISGSPLVQNGPFEGTLAVFTDIHERVQAEEMLSRRAREMAALYETSLEINSQPDPSALLNAVVRRASELLGAKMGGLYLMRPEEEALELVVSYNLPRDYVGTKLRLGEGLSGRIAQTGEAMMIGDYRHWQGRAAIYSDDPFGRVLGVPLKVGDRIVGVLNVTDDESVGPFDEDEIRLVSLFADQAAIAMENARLFEAERTARKQAETLQAATQALTATLDLQQVFELILTELRRVVPYDSATVQQLQEEKLVIIGGHGFPNLEELLGVGFDLSVSDNPNQQVVRSRAPLVLEDAPAIYEEFGREPHAQAGIRSWLGVPLLFGDRLIGMLALDKQEPGFYTQNHARLAMAFAAHAAIAVENARLFQAERQQRQLAETLREAASVLNTSLELDEILRLILEQLRRVLVYDTASVVILRQDNQPDLVVGVGYADERVTSREAGRLLRESPVLRQMARDLQPVVSGDVRHLDGWIWVPGAEHVRSWLGIPLVAHGRMLGALMADHARPGFFGEAELQMAQALAQHAAQAIDNARLFQAEREQHELTEALRQAAAAVSSSLDLDQVLDQILEQVHRMVPGDAANVSLIEGGVARMVRWRGYERFGQDIGLVTLDVGGTPGLYHMQQTGEAIVIPDIMAYPGWITVAEVSWLRSYAAAPIRIRDQVIGFLNVDSATPAFFTQAHADRLLAFADQASLAIEHARLYRAEQRRAAEAAAVSAVAQALNAATDLQSAFEEVARELHRVVDFDRLSLALQLEGGQNFVMQTLIGKDRSPLTRGATVPMSASAAAADILAGRPHLTPDLSAEIDFPAERALYDGGLRSRLNLPLILGQAVIGALNLGSSKPNAFSPDLLPMLTQVANAVASTVHTVRLYEEILQRNRELTLLNRIIAASAASQETASILETVCRELALVFGVPQSAAALFNADKTEAVVVAEYLAEGRPPSLGEIIPARGNPSSQYLLKHKAPLAVENAQTDPRLAPIHDLMRQRGTVSLLVLPLIVEGEVVGSLGLDAIERRPFSEEEVNLAWRVAEQVSGSLARARLVETQRRLSTAVEQAAEAVVIGAPDMTILYVNPAFERITGIGATQVINHSPLDFPNTHQDEALINSVWQAINSGQTWLGRYTSKRPDESVYTVDLTVTPVRSEAGEIINYVATMRDVTREVRLEEQFYQAQKMEALGQLAGGIAHDFNNLLTVIHLSTQLLRRRLHPEDPLWEHVRRIEETGERAARLTKQLLSFSRREIVEPKLINLNQLVDELGNMLRRIIGENIRLETRLAPDLWAVKIDPSQMDQVILNLAVNARDAMPQGGALSIETLNVTLDQAYAASHVDVQPGRHVALSISDTGVGMDETVRNHLFEPFFTTKDPGQGTGLGLATVFGIIKQNRGHIRVSSNVGQGTTFQVYLPYAGEGGEYTTTRPLPPTTSRLVHGTETVLVVEDKGDVRKLAADVLQSCGYHVLTAGDGLEALQISQGYEGVIHLLVTDIVMPHMNGKDLAERLVSERPGLRVLFMSGYADSSIFQQQGSALKDVFLPKPFTVDDLAHKVRTLLDDRL